MSLDAKAREKAFQDHIIAELAKDGWLVGEPARYNQELWVTFPQVKQLLLPLHHLKLN
ncbi:hypothetical protein [Aeromonas salmonicida]|uniref:hypothetical protein n=1 Tax=Aeromonas salmonicida TaxID=645 RepID=UPI000A54E79E|nr:hypothetical protein [Aeromonas salmonicida]